MLRPYDYNQVRLAAYYAFFNDFLRGEYDTATGIHLLTDVRYAEVSKAFVMSLTRRCTEGAIRPLADGVSNLVRKCATSAFGTCEHDHMPSWFLQNFEGFLASCTHKLLKHYGRHPAPSTPMHRAFVALFQVADGMKRFLGLKQVDTGAHALMTACHHSRMDMLTLVSSDVCASHLAFMEQLAASIYQSPTSCMRDRHNALSFFAKSMRWQQFAKACAPWLRHDSNLAMVNALIERATTEQAKDRAADVVSMASAFLFGSPPTRPRRVHNFVTPPKFTERRVIYKRSRPFLDLVRKLVER